MAVNRRRFLGVGTAALAAACGPLTGCGGGTEKASSTPGAAPAAAPGTPPGRTAEGLVFDFTGLYAVELWQKTSKKVRVVLVDGVAAGLPPAHGLHAPFLVMQWDDINHAKMGGKTFYEAPQPIRMGGTTMAMWSLQDRVVWVNDANSGGYDTDTSSALDIVKGKWDGTSSFPGSDPEWTDLHWLADMREVLKRGTGAPLPIAKRTAIYSEILLTRGLASIRKPLLPCEANTTYRFEYADGSVLGTRTYGTQFGVEYPISGTVVNLMVGTTIGGPKQSGRAIAVKLKPGQLIPISVMNGPLGHPTQPTHFNAFYDLAALPGPSDKFPKLVVAAGGCSDGKIGAAPVAANGAPKGAMTMTPSDNSASPYDGCVPPGFMQD